MHLNACRLETKIWMLECCNEIWVTYDSDKVGMDVMNLHFFSTQHVTGLC